MPLASAWGDTRRSLLGRRGRRGGIDNRHMRQRYQHPSESGHPSSASTGRVGEFQHAPQRVDDDRAKGPQTCIRGIGLASWTHTQSSKRCAGARPVVTSARRGGGPVMRERENPLLMSLARSSTRRSAIHVPAACILLIAVG
jgi:hypothetical protein